MSKNLIIYKASAGSGKTFMLTRQYLYLAFNPVDNYKSILAVTFTNKAANEMKMRILEQLELLSKDPEKSGHKQFLIENCKHLTDKNIALQATMVRDFILHDYSHFSIKTIDSFVQRVIRAFSFELGTHTGYSIELDNQKVIQELTHELYKTVSRDKALLKWLLQFADYRIADGKNWNIKQEIVSLANELFKERFQSFFIGARQPLQNKDLLTQYANVLKEKRYSFENKLKHISEKVKQYVGDNAIPVKDMGRNFGYVIKYLCEYINAPKKRESFIPTKIVMDCLSGIEKWYPKSNPKALYLLEPHFDFLSLQLHNATDFVFKHYSSYLTVANILQNYHAFGILSDLSLLLNQYRTENNVMMISDTTFMLRAIVNNNDAPFIYEKTGNRYKHILIDEFQDTSGFQWDIFKPLIQNNIAESTQNLVVGDVKQSIYRWRGGDWMLLLQKVEQSIGQHAVHNKVLNVNWRSKSNIIRFNNTVFRNCTRLLQTQFNNQLQNSEIDTQNTKQRIEKYGSILLEAYSDTVQQVPKNKAGSGGIIHIEFIKNEDARKRNEWKKEVHVRLPKLLDEILKSGDYSAGDICILTRTNDESKEIVNLLFAWQEENVGSTRYQIISGESTFLNYSPFIRLLISSLKIVLSPASQIEMAHLVYQYSQLFNPGQEFLHDMFSHLNESFLRQNELLPAQFFDDLSLLKTLPLYELIEELIHLFDGYSLKNEHIYIVRFLDVVLEYIQRNSSGNNGFLEWWDEQGHRTPVELSGQDSAMQVMTIHKSKGLSFKLVVLPFFHWQFEHQALNAPILWVKNTDDFNKAFSYIPVKYKNELLKTSFSEEYLEEKLYALMDAYNAMYVAFTRAEEGLYIFGPENTKRKGAIKNVSDLLQEMIDNNPEENDKDGLFLNIRDTYSVSEGKFQLYGIKKALVKQQQSKHPEFIPFNTTRFVNWKEKVTVPVQKSFSGESGITVDDNRSRGTLLHEMLAGITTHEQIPKVLSRFYHNGKIALAEIDYYEQYLIKITSYQAVKHWFSGEFNVFNERNLLTPGKQYSIPDRILQNDAGTIIIDFKFGEPDTSHHTQVKYYMMLLYSIEGGKVSGYLYYPNVPKVVEVK